MCTYPDVCAIVGLCVQVYTQLCVCVCVCVHVCACVNGWICMHFINLNYTGASLRSGLGWHVHLTFARYCSWDWCKSSEFFPGLPLGAAEPPDSHYELALHVSTQPHIFLTWRRPWNHTAAGSVSNNYLQLWPSRTAFLIFSAFFYSCRSICRFQCIAFLFLASR